MGIRVVVFDFDGTLIDSNALKYNAYFKLFPADERHDQVIRSVLSEIFEKSRYVILKEILHRLGQAEYPDIDQRVGDLALRYNGIVVEEAKQCPEIPGAAEALKKLTRIYGLYVSSTTPDTALKEIIRYRKWNDYFRGVFGFPHEKPETLRGIRAKENLRNDEILVVGDGESDRDAARQNRCSFIPVDEKFRFEDLEGSIMKL
jgi:phosphoglycolate phosphatase